MAEFEFKTEIHLVKLLGLRARNLRELYEILKTVPLSCVYYHTHRFLKQHHFLSPEPPNDFAYWIKNKLNIKDLAEAMASVDTVKFSKLEDLRNELCLKIEDWLKLNLPVNNCPEEEAFHFMSCQTFVLPTGERAGNLMEFIEKIKNVDINSIYFHIFEARLRLKKEQNDFQAWLSEIGEREVAKKLLNLDPYNMTLENLRKKIIRIISGDKK
ncbi:MAG: hypothetical protein Fur0012_11980 [Elusimicrobiota bacterium]